MNAGQSTIGKTNFEYGCVQSAGRFMIRTDFMTTNEHHFMAKIWFFAGIVVSIAELVAQSGKAFEMWMLFLIMSNIEDMRGDNEKT